MVKSCWRFEWFLSTAFHSQARKQFWSSSCSWFWFKQIYTLMIVYLRLRLLNERWKLNISNVPFWLIFQSFIYFYNNQTSKTTFFLLSVYNVVGNRAIRVWKMSIKIFLFFSVFLIFSLPLHSTKERKKQGSKQAAAAL